MPLPNLKSLGWLIFAAILIAASAAGYYFLRHSPTAPSYRTAKVERGQLTASVSASGTLNAVTTVQVGSQVSGQLKTVLVDFNSPVKKWQLIAQIDPEAFEYRLRQAQADVDTALAQSLTQQANINAARAALAREEVNRAEAQRNLQRKQSLFERGFISAAERDTAQTTLTAQEEQVKTTQAQLAVAQAQARSAQAAVKQREAQLAQARVDLEHTQIRAPVDGVVIKKSVEPGQTVAASLQAPELFVIAQDLRAMQVETSIDEADVGRIRVAQHASFTVDAFPNRTYQANVVQIRKAAQNVQNVVTYIVIVSARNNDLQLLPGMTANVRIVTDQRKNVLEVPNAALRFRPPTTDAEPQTQHSAQHADTRQSPASSSPWEQLHARLKQNIRLTPEQTQQIDRIFAAQDNRSPPRRNEAAGGAQTPDRTRRSEQRRAQLRMQIEEILTAEQREQYTALVADESAQPLTPGRLYLLVGNQLKPVDVRVGISNGNMSEVLSDQLHEGQNIVIGMQNNPRDDARTMRGPRLGL